MMNKVTTESVFSFFFLFFWSGLPVKGKFAKKTTINKEVSLFVWKKEGKENKQKRREGREGKGREGVVNN